MSRSTASWPRRCDPPGLPELFDQPLELVSGALPTGVQGRYLFNGPTGFERGGLTFEHWLDGVGRMVSLQLGPDGARLTSRNVATETWREERSEGRALYRGFGTSFANDRLVRGLVTASPVNVSLYPWAGHLLAFGEQGLPYRIAAENLDSEGPWTFGGRLTEITPFTGHPKLDLATGELLAFGVSFSARHPSLLYYRFAPDGSLATRTRTPLPGPWSIHDFAISADHVVFHLSPYRLSMTTLQHGGSVLDALSWPADEERSASRLLVLDRTSGEIRLDAPIGRGYCLHLANAFDHAAGLIVDLLEMPRPIYSDYRLERLLVEAPAAVPVRLEVDLRTGTVSQARLPHDRHADFPTLDRRRIGRESQHYWMLSISHQAAGRPRPYYDTVSRVDWTSERIVDLWTCPPGGLLGAEPGLIPADLGSPAGDTLIVPYHEPDAGRWGFVVLDARRPGPPLARWILPDAERIHLGFHSTFLPTR